MSSDKGEEGSLTTGALQQILTAVTTMMVQQELQRQQQQFFTLQQQQFADLMHQVLERNRGVAVEMLATGEPADALIGQAGGSARSSPMQLNRGSHVSAAAPGSMIRWIAAQIPEFGGSENENVLTWVKRVDKVSVIHGASDGVTLLAASSRLMKTAKQWYEFQDGAGIESWIGLKTEIVKMFERKALFYKVIQKVEARKWAMQKESFDEYAIEKLTLIHRLDLPVRDIIHLLISGIPHSALRATALSTSADSVENFLKKMRPVVEGVVDNDKKATPIVTGARPKGAGSEGVCKNCGKKGHSHQECRGEPTCFYCKEKGHRLFECPLIRRKEGKPPTPTRP